MGLLQSFTEGLTSETQVQKEKAKSALFDVHISLLVLTEGDFEIKVRESELCSE